MTAIQWYYARGQQQCGPVLAAELKRLAEQGELTPDSLVWREGLKDWLPARAVKGLFEGEAAMPKAAPLSEAPSAAPPVALPGPPVQAAGTPGPRPTGETPSPSAHHAGETPVATGTPGPLRGVATFEHSPAAFQRSREGKPSHLFDFVLARGRIWFTPQFVASAARLFAEVGHYALYAAMVLVLALGVTMAVETKAVEPALVGLAAVLALAYLQYAARRFLAASERLNRVTPAKMGSSAPADCTAILFAILGLVVLIGVTVLALVERDYGRIATAVAGFIVCEYLAVAAMNPECLNLSIVAEAGAVQELLGNFAFLGRLWLSMAPVAFGAGVVWGTIEVGVHWAWPPPPTPAAAVSGLGGLADLIGPAIAGRQDALKDLSRDVPELRGMKGMPGLGGLSGAAGPAPTSSAPIGALFATTNLLLFGAWPILAYYLFLGVNFVVDLFSSVVSIPGKLDKLRPNHDNDEGESQ